jgi:flavin-dependent dehydrogenase
MTRFGVKRGDLARALAQRSEGTGKQLTEGQAQDELDRLVHGIVTSLRRGRPAEMPGVGTITAPAPVDEKTSAPGPHGAKKKAATPRKSKS